MKKLEVIPDHSSIRESYSGLFGEVPAIDFGLAGKLEPLRWELLVTKTFAPQAGFFTIQNILTLYARIPGNPHGGVIGNYGFPHAGKMAEYAYGYGSAGLISELPSEIINVVQGNTHVELLQSEEVISYEYGYSHETLGDSPVAAGDGTLWWNSEREADNARLKDERWDSGTFLLRRRITPTERFV